jgi:hypothetical protein
MDLKTKIRYINRTVPIGVVANLVGIDEEVTSQIHCPFHDDSNKSARIFIHDVGNSSNGIFCYVCGQFRVWDIAFRYFGDDYKETFNYFENTLKVKYKGLDISEDEDEDRGQEEKLARVIKSLSSKRYSKKIYSELSTMVYNKNFKKLRKFTRS